ncbi:MAG: DUF3151 domain-containing protein [Actinomycetales bacterium]
MDASTTPSTTPERVNLLGGPEPTLLPADEHDAVRGALEAGATPAEAAAANPAASLAWALLAAQAWDAEAVVESYAYARVGYHRGLDALRRQGWRGHGPVPFSHEPNRGFLMSLHALARAAAAIQEADEAQRCRQFLLDCDPRAAEALD